MRVPAAIALTTLISIAGAARAQSPLPAAADDVLVLDMQHANEPACAIPVHSSALCAAERAAKADRWLAAIFKSCMERAEERDATWGSGWNTADSRRRSQEAFLQYREAQARAMADWVHPGNAVGIFMWGVHFDLTVERATMLLGYFGSRHRDLGVIDLTTTDWCDR